ncbi:hypothetical protein NMG60_11012847 [Bertholletia excelsa]
MPLVRVQLRNEYGLGQSELYGEADGEDPKAILEGVAVAGLVGILRQLGDLTEFAAEVFHGLQEQVMSTSSRSHKLMVRVQYLEATLPTVEKTILSQKSHLHFAYTAGSSWHAHLQNEQNHFVYSDLPQFIMNSYEECRKPPRLHLLDKFDTGGPGSCLKRYSDPTFLRRASAKIGETNYEVSEDRKACRSNKSRRLKNGVVIHDVPISNLSDRTQCASLEVDKQMSPPMIFSMSNGTLKSKPAALPRSFNSRAGSGYRPTYTMKPAEHESRESSSSSLRMEHNDAFNAPSVDLHSRVVDEDLPRSSLEEQTGPRSSSVTWEEKTEIIESTTHHRNQGETAEKLAMNFVRDTQEKGAASNRNDNQRGFLVANEDMVAKISSQNQDDDIESEPDNYMDALNTIESESETDLDLQTKREIEQSSNLSADRKLDEVNGLTTVHSELQPSNLESHAADHGSLNEVTLFKEPKSISSESYSLQELTQIGGESSNVSNPLGVDICGTNNFLDGSKTECDIKNLPFTVAAGQNPQPPVSDNIVSTSCESHNSLAEPSRNESVQFWTNGALLGLEPSKPPDLSTLNAASQDTMTESKNNKTCVSSQGCIPNGDIDMGKPNKLQQSSKSIEHISSNCSTFCHNDQDDISDRLCCRFLAPNCDSKCEKNIASHQSNRANDNHGCTLSRRGDVMCESGQAVNPDLEAMSKEASQIGNKNAPQVFGLSNRFCFSGFQKNVSLIHDESDPPSFRKTNVSEQKSRNESVASQTHPGRTFKGCFRAGSAIILPSSSPPIQHMKISFQPVNGFQSSKVKLKCPYGSNYHDKSRDMLPSFQLVPEPATPLHDGDSDSDDNTFYRSSPYMSDGHLSHQSGSNSDHWESDYTPSSKDNELYSSLRRISSGESISSSLEHEDTKYGSNCLDFGHQSTHDESCPEPYKSGHSLDIPSFSTVNALFEKAMKTVVDVKDLPESDFPIEPTPLPPPLPPLQWRVVKPPSDMPLSKPKIVTEAHNHAFNTETPGTPISWQPEPSPIGQQQNTEKAIPFMSKSKQHEWQRLNGCNEVDQAISGKQIDEKDDFLHQIRTKSFSLRRTVTEKPAVTTGLVANDKVTAILEKANAIRQAVGSDEGEDNDNWSDT